MHDDQAWQFAVEEELLAERLRLVTAELAAPMILAALNRAPDFVEHAVRTARFGGCGSASPGMAYGHEALSLVLSHELARAFWKVLLRQMHNTEFSSGFGDHGNQSDIDADQWRDLAEATRAYGLAGTEAHGLLVQVFSALSRLDDEPYVRLPMGLRIEKTALGELLGIEPVSRRSCAPVAPVAPVAPLGRAALTRGASARSR